MGKVKHPPLSVRSKLNEVKKSGVNLCGNNVEWVNYCSSTNVGKVQGRRKLGQGGGAFAPTKLKAVIRQ